MSRHSLVAAALLALVCGRSVDAAETESFLLKTPDGPVRVDRMVARGAGPRPAVIVLSGSKGFGSAAYAEVSGKLNGAGLDVFELHALSSDDLDAIAGAGSAQARIALYATRFPRWTASVHALIARLTDEPGDVSGVGILALQLQFP